jgi:hypothetical protein
MQQPAGRDRGAVEGGSRRTAVMAEELCWPYPLGSEKKGEAGMGEELC